MDYLMCGRYYLSIDLGNLSFVDNLSGYDFEDNFNIAPQANVPIVIDNNLVNCTWGYYPQWLKDQSNSKPLFNTSSLRFLAHEARQRCKLRSNAC